MQDRLVAQSNMQTCYVVNMDSNKNMWKETEDFTASCESLARDRLKAQVPLLKSPQAIKDESLPAGDWNLRMFCMLDESHDVLVISYIYDVGLSNYTPISQRKSSTHGFQPLVGVGVHSACNLLAHRLSRTRYASMQPYACLVSLAGLFSWSLCFSLLTMLRD